ncbi:carnitine O-palmitoyltransferase 1, liver isoform-like [Ornithodoros turicata]|uniref:carnitine O-palmitoyltransferase n=1 Tax=Ornithodoros turicata TaxID=34597 RepID=A0A2R5L8V4_9ACAR
MAEAHQAVAFSFTVTHEGVNINYDREVLLLVWQSGLYSWKKRFARFLTNVYNGVYPSSYRSLYFLLSIVTGLSLAEKDGGVVAKLAVILPSTGAVHGPAAVVPRVAASGLLSLAIWVLWSLCQRYMLKALFLYKGWMYEARGSPNKVSWQTRLWFFGVKVLRGRNPLLFSYQSTLPKLPLPSLDDTMARYLRSVQPLLDDANYTRMEKLALEFRNGIGVKLQRYLWLKSWWSANYVSDWWEEYVYLRGRSPIMVNSNFYAIDAIFVKLTSSQAARAANLIYASFLFRRGIDTQQMSPIMVQGMVPLCSRQYERQFNTTRVPGVETDRLVHYTDSQHVVVYHKGRYFKLATHFKQKLLQPCDLQRQLERILSDQSVPQPGEEKLGALTASERSFWAQLRTHNFRKGVNRVSLDAIEKAAFVVVLDEEEYYYDHEDPSKLNHYARALLHGKGYDRWFDKSFNLVVGRNGRVGFNAEHSWADAPIMGHYWEFVLAQDFFILKYDEAGSTLGHSSLELPAPVRLRWDLTPQLVSQINASAEGAEVLLKDVDLHLLSHSTYGKGFMKKCRCSPDAYIQMALQLAYYRDAGKFSLTYEASMTRLFREGRTETVRPVTVESRSYVLAMQDPACSVKERCEKLRAACDQHQLGYQNAMCGKGIDRHLFCLYVVSKYLEVDSPFLREVLSEPWRLSTSQTPHNQTTLLDLRKFPNFISAGGGFGPVADDGYGVSYLIAGEDHLFFHISSKMSSPETDSLRFARHIEQALKDMRDLFKA